VPRAVFANGAVAAPADDVAPRRGRDDVRGLGAGMTAEARFAFEGQVAIVTGAARGVGREIVRAFADAGARVVAADRDRDGLAETCAPHRAGVSAIVADVSTADGAQAIVDRATKTFGRLDICVNNAAVAPHAALLEEQIGRASCRERVEISVGGGALKKKGRDV